MLDTRLQESCCVDESYPRKFSARTSTSATPLRSTGSVDQLFEELFATLNDLAKAEAGLEARLSTATRPEDVQEKYEVDKVAPFRVTEKVLDAIRMVNGISGRIQNLTERIEL